MKKLIAALILAIVFISCTFSVDNTESVIVIRLGVATRVVEKPGLNFKIPILESTVPVSNRLMYYASQPYQVITKDKKSILIDNYCQWKVTDPKKLYLAVRGKSEGEYAIIRAAATRLDDFIYSGLLAELAKHDLIDIINEQRQNIMKNVIKVASEKAFEELGIEIIDVRIKKADLPAANEENIFARMITERERIAKQYRSEGQEEAQKIKAKTDAEVAKMLAEAEKNAQIIRGEADAKAIELYAKAFSVDPDFYEFNKILTFYTDNKKPMKILITTDSKMFKHIKK